MTGVMAIFERRDDLLAAIAETNARRVRGATAFAPAFDERVLQAAGATTSPVASWTLAGGIAGASSALAFTVWTIRQWPTLIVSGKPLIAWPPLLIIAFELMILVAAAAAMIAFLAAARRARRGTRGAYDPSLSDARFGLLIPCGPARVAEIGEAMTTCGAVTWRVV